MEENTVFRVAIFDLSRVTFNSSGSLSSRVRFVIRECRVATALADRADSFYVVPSSSLATIQPFMRSQDVLNEGSEIKSHAL